jgi:Cd2+/Zn2+-exporting ATPase/Cu+-exporting ATPase
MSESQILEIPIQGMDCADCTRHVRQAIAGLPGVESVEVFLGSEKAVLRQQAGRPVDLAALRKAVAEAGYSVPAELDQNVLTPAQAGLSRRILAFLGLVFGAVLFVVVAGEGLGLFEALTRRVPWPLGFAAVLLFGYPVFREVLRAAFRGQVIAHTLMSLGALAALAVGEWATAAVVVFFMRVGVTVERFTAARARSALRDLSALAPWVAHVLRGGVEVAVPVEQVQPGETVIVRPGEKIPVDGEVLAGQATVDQAAITGESLPVEAGPGSQVFAATLISLGSLRIRADQVGRDTTFGRVIQLVEQAEAQRGDVQRVADRFSIYYLPVVAGIAALTFLLRRDPLAAVAVLVVACSCSFALATPIAILASIGAAARHGLLIKGGKYLETLAKADVLLIDKTGTLTQGKPAITDIVASDPYSVISNQSPIDEKTDHWSLVTDHLLRLAASAERYSEHPLAEAVRLAAFERGLSLSEPEGFEAIPGMGVQALVDGKQVAVGSRRMIIAELAGQSDHSPNPPEIEALAAQGKTLLYVAVDGRLAGALAAEDTLRPEAPEALAAARDLGVRRIELLTGDHPQAAAALAGQLGVDYRAGLLPEDKIAIVKDYQARGHTVVMVGDGVNDAPALAQADVGLALGAASQPGARGRRPGTGSPVALEAAHIILLREDWRLVPQVWRIAQRTMRVIRMNIGFTALYNLVGLSLAAAGLLPPIFAAAAQSLPDLGILANSSRLLKQKF